jgi:hypothetical protein
LKALFKILAFIVIMPLLLLAAVIYFILQPNENEILRCAALALKTQEPNKWEQYHRLIWEETFGPIPKDKIVRFITKDKMNVHPFNLELIDRKINMKNNTIHRYPMEVKQSIRILSKLKKRINEKQVI